MRDSADEPRDALAGDLRSLLAAAQQQSDYGSYLKLCRKRRKLAAELSGDPRRIAVLGGATTGFLKVPLSFELEARGIAADLHIADFNTLAPEMFDPASATAAFAPQIAVVLPTPFGIPEWPIAHEAEDAVAVRALSVASHFLGLCESLHRNTGCDIVLGNFHPLPERPFGSLGSRLPWDRNGFLRRVNAEFGRHAPDYVYIFDIESLASDHGIRTWFDLRLWHHAKQPVSFDCILPLVRGLSALIAAISGKAAKCLVLDLDNTLWGGVVGDDGPSGIRIGAGDAEGEAFAAFQEHVLRLKQRGVLLAVASKNEPENARAAFHERPEMPLKLSDFVAFKANWNHKTQSLAEIAYELNIGLDALVLVDDNPAERALVRQALPAVRVVEVGDDPADYGRLLDEAGWFELARLTAEDWAKTDHYRQNRERHALQSASTDYESYLRSLEQRAAIGPFRPAELDRITQLINKTNQFNLTTRRMTRSEVAALLDRPDVITLWVRLVDRFGDNGLISVIIGEIVGDVLVIETWLMSCRVLKRGVEFLVAERMIAAARARRVRCIRGRFSPTERNKMVASLFADLGFREAGTDGTTTLWEIGVDEFVPRPVQIEVMENMK